jgi:hypothetical protein
VDDTIIDKIREAAANPAVAADPSRALPLHGGTMRTWLWSVDF